MGLVYATVQDLTDMWRPMTAEEQARAGKLLAMVSASLRIEAKKVGKNLDAMVEADEDLREVARSVAMDVTARALQTSTNQEPMTQFSESAGGYSASGTFLVPGGGLFIKRSELARLRIRNQRIGVTELYGDNTTGDNDCTLGEIPIEDFRILG